jgi:hypothetical protein
MRPQYSTELLVHDPARLHFDHQKEQGPQIRNMHAAAMFWAVGAGKTRSDIEDTIWQFANDKIDAHLILAPENVHAMWVKEQIPQWMYNLPNYRALAYKAKSKAKDWEWGDFEALVDYHGLKILTMYYSALASKSGWEFIDWWVDNAGRVKITCDESHRIMTPGNSASIRLAKLRDRAVIRRIMTATPTGQGPQDLYSQYRFLDPAIIGASTFAEYKGMFVHEVAIPGVKWKRIAGYRNIKYLNKRIAPYTFVAKQPPGLPPRHYVTIPSTLSEEQQKHYDDIRYDYQTQLRNGSWVTGEIAITRIKRLLQIAAGHLPILDEEGNKTGEFIELECPRIRDLIDTVRGCPEKVIVWAEEHYEIERLATALSAEGVGAVTYYGKLKDTVREANLFTFENDKDIKCLVANPATGGTGFTVVGVVEPVSAQVFYSHNWSRIFREQCEGRIHRPGTKAERCTYLDIIGCSMDAKVRKRVQEKDDLAKLIEDPRAVASLLDDDLDYLDTTEPLFASPK